MDAVCDETSEPRKCLFALVVTNERLQMVGNTDAGLNSTDSLLLSQTLLSECSWLPGWSTRRDVRWAF